MAGTATSLEPLEKWIERQALHCVEKLSQCISATSLVKERPGFGQVIRPAKGSVVASPSTATGPEPDYFFHWIRDAAIVMDAARLPVVWGLDADAWRTRFMEYVRFSLDLQRIDGAEFVRHVDFRSGVSADMMQYVRPDEEIIEVRGARVAAEARYNADGSLDFIRWSRPQHDGPALRALTSMRWWELGEGDALASLIESDLEYTVGNAGRPCFDLWEEYIALHYHTLVAQWAALGEGVRWARAVGKSAFAARLNESERTLRPMLERFQRQDFYTGRVSLSDTHAPQRDLDFAVILAVLHAGLDEGPYSVSDPRILASFQRLEALFAEDYVINAGRKDGIAFGRYRGDRYFSGGAYHFCTFGAAEFCYRLARVKRLIAFVEKGDAIIDNARRYIPQSGELFEQFDQKAGVQTSARDLAWSYASCLTAIAAREKAVRALS